MKLNAFRDRLAEIGATQLEPYRAGHIPVRMRCAAGHECAPQPSSVMAGRGICRTCAGQDPAMAEAAFRARLAELGATLLEPYRGAVYTHQVRCAFGHICTPRPNSVQQGRGICRACAGRVWDVFYVVVNRPAFRIKFGITSGDPRDRLATHRLSGYEEVLRLMIGLPGTTAPEMESVARAALALGGEIPVKGREYYDISALAIVLDVTDNWPLRRAGEAITRRAIPSPNWFRPGSTVASSAVAVTTFFSTVSRAHLRRAPSLTAPGGGQQGWARAVERE